MLRSVELFVGAGGLAQGSHLAGFAHEAVVEWNRDACETLRLNQKLGAEWLHGVGIHEEDVTRFDYGAFRSDVTLLAGGPPCQPFSLGGRHKGPLDKRDMFPEFVRAMRELRPKAILVENVRGLTRQSFAEYLEYVFLQMSHPELEAKPDEDWVDHLARLEKHHTSGGKEGLAYNVVFRVLNAADYGVPQRRERVFFVGFRADLGIEWSFPTPTHTREALLHDQWVTGAYWERHNLKRPQIPERLKRTVERMEKHGDAPGLPWVTARDAINDLPDPRTKAASRFANHVFQDGARAYPGHTGSPLDEPAKTLKAGVHGVPGGENMIAFEDGTVRYFTAREAARLQTFPDEYVFTGAWSEVMRQLGNAVPVKLATTLAQGIRHRLEVALQGVEL